MIDPAVIIARAAAIWQTTADELLGPRRFARVAAARHAIAYVLRQHGYGLEEIGALLRRDHTTIISSLRAAEARMRTDRQYAADVAELLSVARAHAPQPPTTVAQTVEQRVAQTTITPGLRVALTFWGISRPRAA